MITVYDPLLYVTLFMLGWLVHRYVHRWVHGPSPNYVRHANDAVVDSVAAQTLAQLLCQYGDEELVHHAEDRINERLDEYDLPIGTHVEITQLHDE